MPKLIKATLEVCQTCAYYHIQAEMCGYALDTGRLRAFKDGKQILKRGQCDKYEPRSLTGRRKKRPDELFGNTV